MRKSILFIVTLILVLSFSTAINAEGSKIKIYLNGEELVFQPEQGIPYEYTYTQTPRRRIMIPIKYVLEKLGHKFEWNQATQRSIIDDKFTVAIGGSSITSKEVNYNSCNPNIKDGILYTDLTILTQALRYSCDYEKPSAENEFNYIVNIYKKPKPEVRSTDKVVKMKTDVVVPNYNSVTNVRILTNGNSLDIAPKHGYPFIDKQGRTMIPLRIIGERLGHKVEWDQTTQTATIDDKFNITVGENEVKTKNGTIKMDTKAIIKDGRTFVPLRFIVEALGYKIDYREPMEGNRYTHMVDIRKEGLLVKPLDPPIKDGDIYRIVTESGIVEFNPETDLEEVFGVKMGLTDEKAIELLEPLHKSIKLTIKGDNIRITMYKPELPTDIGMKYNASIELVMKEGRGYGGSLGIWGSNGPAPHVTLRDDGYIDFNYNETPMDDVEYITFSAVVDYKGRTSIPYKVNLSNGKIAIGNSAFLFD